MSAFGDYQFEIYAKGLSGIKPKLPVDFANLEARARAEMPEDVYSYVASGCGDERTQNFNVSAFDRWGLVPRMLVDCATRDLSVELFGIRFASPLFLCPIGVLGICAQDGHGDLATARAAAQTGVPMIASTLSNDPMEAIAKALNSGTGFFQLYTPADRGARRELRQPCGSGGVQGDRRHARLLAARLAAARPQRRQLAAIARRRARQLLQRSATFCRAWRNRQRRTRAPRSSCVAGIFGQPLTWADLPWLRSLTKLPLILKGICHPDDARRAIDAGADAIYCSNHGGRQANGGAAAIDMLPQVVAACGKTPVLFDSGVRSGADVVKALALGARLVGIGRPYAYGLALDGTDGVAHVLRCLLAEADLLMAIDGYPKIADLTSAALMRV